MTNSSAQPRRPAIAAIVPAYNEERSIAAVVEALCGVESLDEIILVDDGSKDRTLALMRQAAQKDPRIRVIAHETNLGKGQAIFSAWATTTAPTIVMLDADLHALTPGHVRALSAPVLDRRADMTLGLFWGGHIHTDFSSWGAPFLTGQRGLRASILKHVSREAAQGYGFEIALTIAAHKNGYRSRAVPLEGVWHPTSEFHRGFWSGMKWRARMYAQILRAWYVATLEEHPNAKAFLSNITKP